MLYYHKFKVPVLISNDVYLVTMVCEEKISRSQANGNNLPMKVATTSAYKEHNNNISDNIQAEEITPIYLYDLLSGLIVKDIEQQQQARAERTAKALESIPTDNEADTQSILFQVYNDDDLDLSLGGELHGLLEEILIDDAQEFDTYEEFSAFAQAQINKTAATEDIGIVKLRTRSCHSLVGGNP